MRAVSLIILLTCFLLVSTVSALPQQRKAKKQHHTHSQASNGGASDDLVSTIGRKPQEGICGYEGCPRGKPDMLNVHIVPHTHDDVGWLKTVDQYYYGSKTLIQKAGVQYILDSVVQELLRDSKKRFIYVESAFFFKWWREQTDILRDQVKMLVNEGRLEFIGGAWSMNDEATVHYQSVIDQFTWGLRRLNDTFGECGRPRVGWQIDPFGHSREMASMFAQMGFDGMFFGRLDYEDKMNRMTTKQAEMIWRASANLGKAADLFTGVLFNNYGPPPGFCFDILCSDEPIIDGRHSPDNNVEKRINSFFKYAEDQAKHYRTNNIILTMGGDFTYMDAHVYFLNLDKLIRYGNERQKNGSHINLFYSTPSCYLKSLHDADITWPTKTDDFFPYASDPHAFWTGYFSSRPSLKRFERVGNHLLQICKQLVSMAPSPLPYFEGHLTFLRESMGIMQHHDAVTGTEKQMVADDYARRLQVGIDACSSNVRIVLNQFTTGEKNLTVRDEKQIHEYVEYGSKSTFDFHTCDHLNVSVCSVSEKSTTFIVTLYNPLARSTFEYVRIPVVDDSYEVTDYRGVPTTAQLVPIAASVKSLDFRRSNAEYELVFLAGEIPPVGYKSYFISRTKAANDTIDSDEQFQSDAPQVVDATQEVPKATIIGNKYLNLTFNSDGILSFIDVDGEQKALSQNFYYYEGAYGDNREFKNRSSGAYIFRPNSTQLKIDKPTIKVVRGKLVEEVHQTFNDWISQVIRIYHDYDYVEFEWLVGPIPIGDKIGKEVISQFESDIKSQGTFFTDSNGREMLKRVVNYRETWNVKLAENISGNYYPVTTKIALEDDSWRMAVLTDRAQGGSSSDNGNLELMVHRRLLHDDAFGVDEALNEKAFGKGLISRGKHYLYFGRRTQQTPTLQARERFLQTKVHLPSWLFFSNASSYSYKEWHDKYSNIRSGLSLSLPQNIHLLTLEPWKVNSFLLRLEHILEKDEDPEYSKSVTVNLKDIFGGTFEMVGLRETTLAGNQWLGEAKRMRFNADTSTADKAQLNDDGIDQSTFAAASISVGTTNTHTATSATKSNRMFDSNVIDELTLTKNHDFDKRKSNKKSTTTLDFTKNDDEYQITIRPMEIRTFIFDVDFQP